MSLFFFIIGIKKEKREILHKSFIIIVKINVFNDDYQSLDSLCSELFFIIYNCYHSI